ncbi:hypothetical protein HMY34_13170 [Thiothrix subterranea]|uniref:hypothetical protein n=1 Tax=Thiothrix subterranea TaxID=2735563 RepID=UPI00192AD116|nr:hypothetical protein [Thiothrix subterranea]QQZ29644.1 hypothetical protein HMY34_13170 [Thiothrix subterranea]
MTTPDLSLEQAQQILQIIATSNPDFAAFRSDFTDAASNATLPVDVLTDTLAVLGEDPQTAAAIEALCNNPNASKSFVTGGEVALYLAVAFVLRTHIKLERTAAGKWKFLIENKPGDSKLLAGLLKKLEEWMGGNSP